MKKKAQVLGGLVVALALAGCSKLERIEDVVAFADRVGDVNDQRVRVLGDPVLGIAELPATAFDAVPTTGTATFLGTAFLSMRNSDQRLDADALVGDSRLEVDFGTSGDAVSGGVTNIRRTQINDISVDVSGQLTFSNGVVGAEVSNDLAFDFGGNVTYDGTEFGLQGRLDGKLRGTRTEPAADQSTVRAFSVRDPEIDVTTATGRYTASMTVIGEN